DASRPAIAVLTNSPSANVGICAMDIGISMGSTRVLRLVDQESFRAGYARFQRALFFERRHAWKRAYPVTRTCAQVLPARRWCRNRVLLPEPSGLRLMRSAGA